MQPDAAWYGTNLETLTAWLDSRGCETELYRPRQPPVVLLDWDNTVVKNDVGDAITFHLIAHDQVLQPPARDWKRTSGYMTDEAAAALTAACGSDIPAGHPLPTSTNLACADEILGVYIDNHTRGGATAFAGQNFRRIEPAYAWTAQLMAGHTHAEIRKMAYDAALPQLAAPIGTTQIVGTRTVNGWLRIYPQIVDLISAARSRGYTVWVITASPTDVVRSLAPLAGLDPDRVVGIHSMTDHAGRLTYTFEGCGPVPDGNQSIIPYIEGKRCWVNKAVFGDTSIAAIDRRYDPRQVLGAGDSDTDVDFLRDSTYKLVLNRNKRELMCYAYDNEGDTWRVNPMFLQPRAQQSVPYPCSTTACRVPDGTVAACRDDHGNVIPDQQDTVF
jgi:haloacid dehalogenase-like hydrolase